jgi:hypothetical protein
MTEQRTFGRLEAPDDRDKLFPMSAVLPSSTTLEYTSKHWYMLPGRLANQKHYPRCVGFAWWHWLICSPLRTTSGPSPHDIYLSAQKVDEWPGEDYDGTSVRAGAKILHSRGHIASYVWAYSLKDVHDFVLNKGPVVVGTRWSDAMMETDSKGYLYPRQGSMLDLGQAYLIIGYSKSHGAFRCVNSWGREWGQDGRFWMKASDFEYLLDLDGEACGAIEQIKR